MLAMWVIAQVAGPIAAQSPAATPAPATPTAVVATPTPAPTAAPTAGPTAAPTAGPTAAPSVAATTPAASPAASGAVVPVASPSGSAEPCPNPTPPPGGWPTPAPGTTPAITPHPNLCPAQINGGDPTSIIAWAFTPVFQVLFMGLAFFYNITRDIGIAIIALTLVIRLLLVPVFRAQIVSQRRMQMLQPELKAIQTKYKGNRAKISEEQMKLYKERGVNPASGCLPALLQMLLLVPMYQVFSQGRMPRTSARCSRSRATRSSPSSATTRATRSRRASTRRCRGWVGSRSSTPAASRCSPTGRSRPTCRRSSSWSCRACSGCCCWPSPQRSSS